MYHVCICVNISIVTNKRCKDRAGADSTTHFILEVISLLRSTYGGAKHIILYCTQRAVWVHQFLKSWAGYHLIWMHATTSCVGARSEQKYHQSPWNVLWIVLTPRHERVEGCGSCERWNFREAYRWIVNICVLLVLKRCGVGKLCAVQSIMMYCTVILRWSSVRLENLLKLETSVLWVSYSVVGFVPTDGQSHVWGHFAMSVVWLLVAWDGRTATMGAAKRVHHVSSGVSRVHDPWQVISFSSAIGPTLSSSVWECQLLCVKNIVFNKYWAQHPELLSSVWEVLWNSCAKKVALWMWLSAVVDLWGTNVCKSIWIIQKKQVVCRLENMAVLTYIDVSIFVINLLLVQTAPPSLLSYTSCSPASAVSLRVRA